MAAGLYLAALSLRGAADRRALIRSFGASSRPVADFLVTEVLEAHDRPVQELMFRCSILERLCGPLCDAVLDQRDSGAVLDALSRTNLFLVPLDDERGWYRFHPLFAQLLRVELEQREPGIAPELHRRASAWHRDHGTAGEAIRHAVKAGAYAEAAGLIEACWFSYVSTARYASVLAWLQGFPAGDTAPRCAAAAGQGVGPVGGGEAGGGGGGHRGGRTAGRPRRWAAPGQASARWRRA